MDTLIAWILRAIPFGTIIMYGAMGEIMTEKSGNLNLGVPGIMYLGGFAGFASAYLHMVYYIVDIGDYVTQGQVIGYMGTTGVSTGPHLHFTIYYNGDTVNPAEYIDFY